ncbi:MAG: outer membrane beta-barrel protein, partial [Thermoguttaceae bacterium]
PYSSQYPNQYPGQNNYPYYGQPPYSPYGEQAESDRKTQLAPTALETLSYFNPFKSPTGPDRGVGNPLKMRSWLDRPFYVGAFAGGMAGSQLIDGLIDQDCGATGGIIFGWYFDNYWGVESRVHFASLPSKDTAYGKQMYEEWAAAQGLTYVSPLTTRNNTISMGDVSLHYYPFGNAKWRPYLKLGIGAVNQQFTDSYGVKHNINGWMIPFGIGFKYWWSERMALQVDLIDNVLFSTDTAKTQGNCALTVGLNFPIGRAKPKPNVPAYWPSVPSVRY